MSLEERIASTPRVFKLHQRATFNRGGISLEQALQFNDYYDAPTIVALVENGISPKIANNFSKRWVRRYKNKIVEVIKEVIEKGISRDKLQKYPFSLGLDNLFLCVERGIEPRLLRHASKFYHLYTVDEIMQWSEGKYPRDDEFLQRFGNEGMVAFLKGGVMPNWASKFDPRYTIRDICLGYKYGLSPEIANRFVGFSALEATILHRVGISPDLKDNQKERLHKVLAGVPSLNQIKMGENYTLLGIAYHSIVLLNKVEKTAYKLSRKDLEGEAQVLDKIKETVGLHPYLISYKRRFKSGGVNILELEYIEGQTLERILKRKQRDNQQLKTKTVLRYSRDLLYGLDALKEAGVYHRDLWLGNIMIDFEHDNRAVIIDFGEATLEPNAPETGSRKYRGDNDLQTLGQLMYKMATGKNLFNTFPDKSSTVVPDDILATILRTRSDQDVLGERIQEIERNVLDNRLKEVIKYSITTPSRPDNTNFAVDEAYTNVREMLKRYRTDIPMLPKVTA